MISFPNAKINLGLRVKAKRTDGFHEIETIMYPFGLTDVLEIMGSQTGHTTLRCTGIDIGPEAIGSNLVQRIYELLSEDFNIPPVYIHLHKTIPVGAGLGGGSSDCTFALKMLNHIFNLDLSSYQQQAYVSRLGSDCAFFLDNKPALASGRGEILEPVDVDLSSYYIYIVKPNFEINTALAYSWVKPNDAGPSLKELAKQPIRDWKKLLANDFEKPVIERFPVLADIKQQLYNSGALYASLSGSGSAVYGIFESVPGWIEMPGSYFIWKEKL